MQYSNHQRLSYLKFRISVFTRGYSIRNIENLDLSRRRTCCNEIFMSKYCHSKFTLQHVATNPDCRNIVR